MVILLSTASRAQASRRYFYITGAFLELPLFLGEFFLFVAAFPLKVGFHCVAGGFAPPPQPWVCLLRGFRHITGRCGGIFRGRRLQMDKSQTFQIPQEVKRYLVLYVYGYDHSFTVPQNPFQSKKISWKSVGAGVTDCYAVKVEFILND